MATVKVRIAVVVSADGNWYAGGWNNPGDQDTADYDAMGVALDVMSENAGPYSEYFIEATLEVPAVETVQAQTVILGD